MICQMTGHPTQKDTVPRGMSKLDDNITQSGSMLEESRDDIWISIAHSKEVSGELSATASSATLDIATSLENQIGQVLEVVSTLLSS